MNDGTAYLISSPATIRYATGFIGSGETDTFLCLCGGRKYLATNSLYIEQANRLAEGSEDTEAISISRDRPLVVRLLPVLKRHHVRKLMLDASVPLGIYLSVRKSAEKLLMHVGSDPYETERRYKKPDELKLLRKAVALTDQAFLSIRGYLQPGVRENRIRSLLEIFFLRKQAQAAFPPIVAFGANASMPHYTGSANAVLGRRDTVLLDFGAKVNGYCADMTRMLFIGEPDRRIAKAYVTVRRAQDKALSVLTAAKNPSGSKADRAAKQVIRQAGFPPFTHSLGHSIGLDVHESPRLTIKKDETIEPGMVFSLEPGIYVEGQFGIRIEDLVYYSREGFEILTQSTKEMIILKP